MPFAGHNQNIALIQPVYGKFYGFFPVADIVSIGAAGHNLLADIFGVFRSGIVICNICLLYTSDAADEENLV